MGVFAVIHFLKWSARSSDVIITQCPSVSNCGRPARPAICCRSIALYSRFFSVPPANKLVPLIMTKKEGKLTPADKVDVQKTA